MRTLKNRYKSALGLRCRSAHFDDTEVRARVQQALNRQAYVNPGPNFCWCTDGNDKLKLYGFCIHACIDDFSLKVLWLWVIQRSYLSVVTENGGRPKKVRTDCGTENGLLATARCNFMADIESH